MYIDLRHCLNKGECIFMIYELPNKGACISIYDIAE